MVLINATKAEKKRRQGDTHKLWRKFSYVRVILHEIQKKRRSRVKNETGGVENLYCGISVNWKVLALNW